MEIMIFSILAVCSIFGGVYLGLCITDKRIVRQECFCQLLTFSLVFTLIYFMKDLNTLLLPINARLMEAFKGDALRSWGMFALELGVILFFMRNIIVILKINAKRIIRGGK